MVVDKRLMGDYRDTWCLFVLAPEGNVVFSLAEGSSDAIEKESGQCEPCPNGIPDVKNLE